MEAVSVIHVDTHVLVWLWERKTKYARLIARRIDGEAVVVSAAAVLELQCLCEIGRFKDRPENVIAGLAQSIGLRVSEIPFPEVVQRSLSLSWTRDPFDRLIVGNAAAEASKLLTCDSRIRENFDEAIWD